jgi:hypothetical protein
MNNADDNDFTVITDVLPPEEAEKRFRQLLEKKGVELSDLDLERDVIMDTFRTADGTTRRRYRLRAAILAR